MGPAMEPGEAGARAYCAALGKDPDELVDGYLPHVPERVKRLRWRWYVGADATVARGAQDLVPRQVPFAARARANREAAGDPIVNATTES